MFSVLSLRLFLSIENVTTPENQMIIVKSLLMSHLVIKQNKSGQNIKYQISNNRYSIKSGKISLQAVLCKSNTKKLQVLIKREPCIILKLFLDFSDSEPAYSYRRKYYKYYKYKYRKYLQREMCNRRKFNQHENGRLHELLAVRSC